VDRGLFDQVGYGLPALPRIGVALTEAYLPGTPLHRLAIAGLQAYRDPA